MYRLVKLLVNTLHVDDQRELEGILADLPPAAMGDEQGTIFWNWSLIFPARSESRVLTNILDDVRSAVSVSTKVQKDCQVIIKLIEELLGGKDYSQVRKTNLRRS